MAKDILSRALAGDSALHSELYLQILKQLDHNLNPRSEANGTPSGTEMCHSLDVGIGTHVGRVVPSVLSRSCGAETWMCVCHLAAIWQRRAWSRLCRLLSIP